MLLKKTNYQVWSLAVRTMLKDTGLWETLTDETRNATLGKLMNRMLLNLNETVLPLMIDVEDTPRAA